MKQVYTLKELISNSQSKESSDSRVGVISGDAPLQIAVIASGTGSNLQALIDACHAGADSSVDGKRFAIAVVITDKPESMAALRAEKHGIPTYRLEPKSFADKQAYEAEIVRCLQDFHVELVVLAGYMRIVGPTLLAGYEGRMINLHPSLLPAFPGLHAQEQAIAAGVKVSGCTVHFVDAGMDTGPIIAQRVVEVEFSDSPETLHQKIQRQEHRLLVDVVYWIAAGKVECYDKRVKVNL